MRTRLIAALLVLAPVLARADDRAVPLPTGQFITPLHATGAQSQMLDPGLAAYPGYRATGAAATAISPDGRTLLVLTSGFNVLIGADGKPDPAASDQYVFVFDIAGASHAAPRQTQVLRIPNAFVGLAWAPDSRRFYVSGGSSDAVFVFSRATESGWSRSATIALNHPDFGTILARDPRTAPLAKSMHNGLGFGVKSNVAGLGVSPDGSMVVAANIANDSVSVIDARTGTVAREIDLRPLDGTAGGEVPFGVAVASDGRAYVSSIRDRQIVAVDLARGTVLARIQVPGTPNALLLRAGTLYAAQDNADQVAVIDTATDRVTGEIDVAAPPGLVDGRYTGAAPNALAVSPDAGTLFVSDGAANAVAVVDLARRRTTGLVPTGWYPDAVSTDGRMLYVANAKSVPGPDPREQTDSANQYILQREPSSLLAIPVPQASDLGELTAQVAANDGFHARAGAADARMMAALHARIRHVIYIVRENRTFDQVLGDLRNGANTDASLTMFGQAVTPNIHRLATGFVTLDNFFDTGEVSGNGWAWSVAARESDYGQRSVPPDYAGRGFSGDTEGTNRNVNVGLATLAARRAGNPLYDTLARLLPGGAANLLPGTNDDFGLDGPRGTPVQRGTLWDDAMRGKLSVRNYGFFVDVGRYRQDGTPSGIPLGPDPAAARTVAAIAASPTLGPVTDPYFRGFDNNYPDVWREREWQREFDGYVARGHLPALSLVRLMHDHMGDFGTAVAGLRTPETQVADNDLAVGRLIQAVARSRYARDTLIFVVEDDAQDGPDHMDAHRSEAFVIGPYVRHHAVVSTRYTTVSMVRTIEDVLGIGHLNLNDAYRRPMTDVFDMRQRAWRFDATASPKLRGTGVVDPGTRFAAGAPRSAPRSAQSPSYWATRTAGWDFSAEDRVPAGLFDRVLWAGLMRGPYPAHRSGAVTR